MSSRSGGESCSSGELGFSGEYCFLLQELASIYVCEQCDYFVAMGIYGGGKYVDSLLKFWKVLYVIGNDSE